MPAGSGGDRGELLGEGRHDAPGKQARGASDGCRGVCRATRFRGAAGRPMLWNNGRVCLMDVMAVLGDVMEVSMLEWASASMGELQLRGGSWPT